MPAVGKASRTRKSREQERRRARTQRMLIATGAAVALVIALIIVQQVTKGDSNRPDPSNLTGLAEVQAEFDGLTETAGTIGRASAKVTITEYGDLRCPICKTFDNEVVPTARRGSRAHGQGEAALQDLADPRGQLRDRRAGGYAASQQNALWRYAALTYLNQGDENVSWFTTAFARSSRRGASGSISRKFDKDRASAAANAAIEKVNGEATAG